ncbi:Endonuclease 4 [Buchnera aphidicola (Neophyllaphis podocarpi)]|uniref:deoxyribonuclease IV n=1 Tax=Buchnera aphidicola TaxID=9 RepID=UPI0034643D4F
MKYIGAHVSISGGLHKSVLNAKKIGATTFALFTKNPLQWNSLDISDKEKKNFINLCKFFNFNLKMILPHCGYLINLGHPVDTLLEKSRCSFINEIIRCKSIGLSFLNVHPGNHLYKITEIDCLKRISHSINIVLDKIENFSIILENTAGQGSSVGYCFDHLKYIIDNIDYKDRIGICIDTCHAFASGYDLRTKEKCKKTFDLFDKIVGLNYLKAFHFNDSKNKFFSNIDRHNNLGKGYIGSEAFIWILQNICLNNIPIILETTNKDMWIKEIIWLKNNYKS